MNDQKKSAIIISASSDIGTAMARRWISKGWNVYGSYRTDSGAVDELTNQGCRLFRCDLSDKMSIKKACSELGKICSEWDVLVLASGSQEPVGSFEKVDFD